jgi:hypothetical protein
MIAPEVDEQEQTVTRVDRAGNGEQTITRTTGTVSPMGLRLRSAVWLVVGVVDLILALDFVFRLVAAANIGFVGFVSTIAGSLATPFQGVSASSVANGHSAYWPDVLGIAVYLIAAWILVSLIGIVSARRPNQMDRTSAAGGR